MRVIAEELVGILSGASSIDHFYRLNPKPAKEISYPYSAFEFSYTPSDATDGGAAFDVDLEVNLYDRGENGLALLDAEEEIVLALKRYRELSPKALSVAKLEQALDVPTLVDGLYRRMLQFTIRMTLREKG